VVGEQASLTPSPLFRSSPSSVYFAQYVPNSQNAGRLLARCEQIHFRIARAAIIGSMKRPDELGVPLFLPEWLCF
jgi:hypothetical protein